VHRHHRHAVVARGAVQIGVECDLIEEARKRRVLRVIFKERENVRLEFLHVFQPSAALHVALLPQRAHVVRPLADKLVEFCKLRRFRRLPQRADEGGKALELARRVLEHGILPRALQNSHHRDILLVCQHLHTLDRRSADAARRIVDDAPQTQIVARVVDDGKIRKHVLDLGTLEELGAAHDLIRHAVAFEGVFERVRLCVHAVQHGIFFPVPAAVVVHHDAADNKIRLVLLVENRLDEHAVARARIGPEGLALPAGVVLDDGIRRVEDILRGAVVLLQADRAAALVFLFKVQNICDVRAAKFVNALVIVADDADVALFPHKLLHQKILQAVRVLILVDEYITELAAVVLAHLVLLLQQCDRMEKNVVKVERVCLGESLHIADINPGDGFLAPVAAVFPAAGIVLRRLHRVLRIRDGRKHLARRELLFINIQFFQDILDDALGIVRIVDRKIARKTEAVNVSAQNAHAGGVERHRPHALRALNAKGREALTQLVCRLIGKRHRQQRPRRGRFKRAEVHHAAALLRRRVLGIAFQECKIVLRRPLRHVLAVAPAPVGQKVCDAVDEHRRLAAARAREQQQRALGRQHAAALFGVEFCKIPRNGRFSCRGIAGVKIAHTFLSHLS